VICGITVADAVTDRLACILLTPTIDGLQSTAVFGHLGDNTGL
jgi:hypothetical protein